MLELLHGLLRCRHVSPIVIAFLVAARACAGDVAPSFESEVIPVFTRFGCNAGACHGKLAGQNGFRLSLRGYAPELDFDAIVQESRGRRITPLAPQSSLLYRKAVGDVPHQGGARFTAEDPAAEVLLRWIAAGAPRHSQADRTLTAIKLTPDKAILSVGQQLQLTAIGNYADRQSKDITWLAQFASSDPSIVEVDANGLATCKRSGEAVVRATYLGQVEIAVLTIPRDTQVSAQRYTERHNAVDDFIFTKLEQLRIEPAPLCDDATFARRVYLDTLGRLPSVAESSSFIADGTGDKRSRLIQALLERPEFNDYWTLLLGDLLQNRKERDHDVRGVKGVRSFHGWLHSQLTTHQSWLEIATTVLTAKGDETAEPAVGYYLVTVGEKQADQSEVVDSIAQTFLGTRIGCARCHNHPLEQYTQDDYYHFASIFSRISLDRNPSEMRPTELVVTTRHGLNLRKQIRELEMQLAALASNGDCDEDNTSSTIERDKLRERIDELNSQFHKADQTAITVRQPRTGRELGPQIWDRQPLKVLAGADPRKALVAWIETDGRELFAGALVNRLWKHCMGVGLVEPVDDLRATNPPSNPALWDFLVHEFIRSDYDIRALLQTIMTSRAYQLAADTNDTNATDYRFYSHFSPRRLPAEVLLDAIGDLTGQPESFAGYPLGMRAIQVPDPGVDSYFLRTFGRSERTTACACERNDDVTLPQLLHLQNSEALWHKITSADGNLSQWLASSESPQHAARHIIQTAYSRLPTPTEQQIISHALADEEPHEVLVDLMWALINSKEFTFQH